MKRLANKTALITGATRGIGFEIAKRYAEEGADLFLTARSLESLGQVKEQLVAYNVRVEIESCDVTDPNSVQGAVSTTLEKLGKIDILVNNAGDLRGGGFLEHSLEDFDHVMKVNLYGVFHMCQAVLPSMLKQGKGKIINMSAIGGKTGTAFQSAYNTSKHAVIGLTRCLAVEFGPNQINVNSICPGYVETELSDIMLNKRAELSGQTKEEIQMAIRAGAPLNRLVTASEVAAMAAYLASSESDSITGQSFTIDSGKLMI